MKSVKDLLCSSVMVDYFLPSCDILEIRNGSSSRYFSGDVMPFHVTTTSYDDNTVIIIDFSSDSTGNEKGFMAYYTITRPPPRKCYSLIDQHRFSPYIMRHYRADKL